MTESNKSVRADQTDRDLEREEAAFRRAEKEMITDDLASPTPLWYRIIMFGLVALGILWIMVFYITDSVFPIPGISMWNIGIGVGLMMIGMIMMTKWR